MSSLTVEHIRARFQIARKKLDEVSEAAPNASEASEERIMTWKVNEITLMATYLNHPPDNLSLGCKAISFVETPSARDVAADEGVMESVFPDILVATGMDRDALNSISWHPQCIAFQDLETMELKGFRIDGFEILSQSNTARFSVDISEKLYPEGK